MTLTPELIELREDEKLPTEKPRTLQQVSNMRFMDAYKDGEAPQGRVEHGAMTREKDHGGDGTQQWEFMPVDKSMHYIIRQVSSGLHLDANCPEEDDAYVGVGAGDVETSKTGVKVEKAEPCETQVWKVEPVKALEGGDTVYRLFQESSNRVLDAFSDKRWAEGRDWQVVTRFEQGDDTQLWIIKPPLDTSHLE